MNCRHCNQPAAPCELVEHGEDKKGCCISCLLRRHEKLAAGVRELLAASEDSIGVYDRAELELATRPDGNWAVQRARAAKCAHQIYNAGLRRLLS